MAGDAPGLGVGDHVDVMAKVPTGGMRVVESGGTSALVEIELGPAGLPSPVTLRVGTSPESARRIVDDGAELLLVVRNGESE